MKLSVLLDIPQCGIYALINDSSKRVCLYYSINIMSHFLRLLEDIKNKRVSNKHLVKYSGSYRFEIIEKLPIPTSNQERNLQLYSIRDVQKIWEDKGYRATVPSNVPVYRFVTRLEVSGMKLFIVSKKGDELLLGVFSSKSECTDYMSFLGTPKYIVCTNSLTSNYYRSTIEE